jgi:hypothetical protein
MLANTHQTFKKNNSFGVSSFSSSSLPHTQSNVAELFSRLLKGTMIYCYIENDFSGNIIFVK